MFSLLVSPSVSVSHGKKRSRRKQQLKKKTDKSTKPCTVIYDMIMLLYVFIVFFFQLIVNFLYDSEDFSRTNQACYSVRLARRIVWPRRVIFHYLPELDKLYTCSSVFSLGRTFAWTRCFQPDQRVSSG